MQFLRQILPFLPLLLGLSEVLCDSWTDFTSLRREPPPPAPQTSRKSVIEGWIEQKLDHFNDSNNATYKMRFLANNQFYKPGGPIFIFVGGEWSISPGWVSGGHMYDMAKELNGYLFYTEHRFYGQSHPTSDLSFENLQYLNVNQALADLAHFIRVKKQEIPGASSSGVILVGASYSATMVTWFRQKYPELANGAWSSSAPLLAKTDFVEYYETVGESIKFVGGENCYNRIEKAFAEMERLVEIGDFETLSEKLNLCNKNQRNQLDLWYLFKSLSGSLAGTVQYHKEGTIERTCEIIMDDENDIDGFAKYVKSVMNGCLTTNFNTFVERYRNTSWDSEVGEGNRQWLFQTCNEFGWYQTSGSANQPFGSNFPVELSYQACQSIFSESFTKETIDNNVNTTNLHHNGMKPNITNVYSTHGHLDPWKRMGVQTDVNAESPAFVIPLASHCADLHSVSKDDSTEMLETKKRTTTLVKQWLDINSTLPKIF
ncbi:putative serine protease K12H4.7 [Phlebotomus argentipes]|uniref:putative serine protease K12H4.7 n=1 Tax=Phlebotomus argentipes TaxID=94469 RepID=UPI002892BE7C|nr:putative serine protease K12H4.7 [Phlebotomus argentipes]